MFLFVSVFFAVDQLAGGFGQFGQIGEHSLPTMDVSGAGFRVRSPSAVQIRFGRSENNPKAQLLPGRTRYWAAATMTPAEGAPTTIVFETSSLGFSAKFDGKIVLRAEGIGAPFITWDEGSVGPGVPSPPCKWILLSWPTRQSPILLVLPGEGVSLTARDTENGFIVESDAKLQGWARFRTPFGFEEVRAQNASDLGRLLERLKPHLDSMLKEGPRILDCSVNKDENGLTARWRFDRSGAVVPQPVTKLMSSGWLVVYSRLRKAGASSGGYLFECENEELIVRFPCRKLQSGRAIVNGSIQTAIEMNLDDAFSVVDASLAYLMGNCGPHIGFVIDRANDALSARSTDDATLRASWALLSSARGRETLLAAELAGIDWVSWLPRGSTLNQQFEAAAILAVASAISNSEELRLLGAMAEAGLRAKVGERQMPLASVRYAIYARSNTSVPDWFRVITSPVRLLSPDVNATADGTAIVVQGLTTNERSVELLSANRLKVTSTLGVERVSLQNKDDLWTLHVVPLQQAVQWRVRLSRAGGGVLPNAEPSPRYSEGRR